jgi:D-serine deaminase-like pyridoxal phosphate-dependent protein
MNPSLFRDLPSPALVLRKDRLLANIGRMIALAGSVDRLRPHVKTHKMPEVVRLLESQGIHKHKCATIAEAEMIARAGGRDVLLAYPMVGPNIARLASLAEKYPDTTFRTVVDDAEAADELSNAFETRGRTVPVLIDLDLGMGRTGIDPRQAPSLIEHVRLLPGLLLEGLHAYDGHLRDRELSARIEAARPGQEQVRTLQRQYPELTRLVLGGTPTFPAHARLDLPGLECSPGTCLLQDLSYASKFPDLEFEHAAFLLTRVISRPRPGRICLDVGYKSVAADPQGARISLVDLPDAEIGPQSEEHLIVDTPQAENLPVGTPLLAIPTHVCPTCALYQEAVVVEGDAIVGRWAVEARDRKIGI